MSTKQTLARLVDLKNEYEKKEQTLLDLLPKKERAELGFPIKNINQLSTFMANGKKYIVRDTVSIKRYKQFEDLQSEVGYGVDFYNLFGNISKSYTYMNAGKTADAAVVLYNVMHGVKQNMDDRENPILMMCALFICTEDEDITKYDEKLSHAKINDWAVEGISMQSFFQLAFSLVNGFTPSLKEVSQSILTESLAMAKVMP